jgi:hypothetical protein
MMFGKLTKKASEAGPRTLCSRLSAVLRECNSPIRTGFPGFNVLHGERIVAFDREKVPWGRGGSLLSLLEN